MDFSLNRDQKDVLDRVEEACGLLRKKEEQSWHAGEINAELEKTLRKSRLVNFPLSAKYGGEGGDFLLYGMMLERIGQEGLSPHSFLLSHDSSALIMQNHATDDQCASVLRNTLASPFKGHFVKYDKEPGGYVLNGEKSFVINALSSDILTVFADGQHGRTAFMARKGDGVHVERLTQNGLRSVDLGKIKLIDCFVRKENIIGNEGFGWKIEENHVNLVKLISAAGYVGAAKDCISELDKIPNKLKANVEAASLLAKQAFFLHEQSKSNKHLTLKAKEHADLANIFSYKTALNTAKYGVSKSGNEGRSMRHFMDLAIAQYS
ncbi:MAG: acyl-CoA/acyl-ACP dehydrogenase [Candidatus Aenigmarchaeota archaeon]|nr:acyl-CoA/acyl-ACP dehydrogenase [Candidatus Aenigmarchaeota archaeon]